MNNFVNEGNFGINKWINEEWKNDWFKNKWMSKFLIFDWYKLNVRGFMIVCLLIKFLKNK